MKLAQPFVRLPFRFDASRLAEEVTSLDATAWMPHPSGLKGNSAVPLISRDGTDNDDFVGAMKITPHLRKSPYHHQVMASLGEVLTRSRLMKLDANCEVSNHVDFNYHWYTRVRVHVPVITNSDVLFYCGDENINMKPGECWVFDNWRRHNVINNGKEDRIHLVIDLAGSSRFWRTVRYMQKLDTNKDAAELNNLIREIPYQPGVETEITTETINTAPVMAPGEIDAMINELIRDLQAHPENDTTMLEQYRVLLTDFARDWREIWLQYGMQPVAVPRYRHLIEQTAAQLHPNRRILVASSNGIGANAIIMQRILNPALAPEMYDYFIPTSDSS
ncbi:MAG: aspartyl/asparaginyl beta-hydroxylase domain-containing protein [Gammaproteobacteria bacterium]